MFDWLGARLHAMAPAGRGDDMVWRGAAAAGIRLRTKAKGYRRRYGEPKGRINA
jgi:hypothetical protein